MSACAVFLRVTLSLTAVLLEVSATSARAADWVVTGAELRQDVPIALDGNLILERGAGLILRAVTLTFNNTANGQYGILVKPGGALTIDSHSLVTSAASDAHMYLIVEDGASLIMRSSQLRRCGWPAANRVEGNGFDIRGSLVMEDNTLSENWLMTVAGPGSGGRIVGNRVSTEGEPDAHINVTLRSGLTITGNTFAPTRWFGIGLYQSHDNVIRDNDFNDVGHGPVVLRMSWNNEFSHNRVIGGSAPYILHRSGNVTVTDNIFDGVGGLTVMNSDNVTIMRNTFSKSQSWEVLLSYTTGSVVADNVFSDIRDFKSLASLELYHASGNLIANNSFSSLVVGDRARIGILLWGSSANNVVRGNEFGASRRGVSIHYGSNRNRIEHNTFGPATEEPAAVEASESNLIHHNNFYGWSRSALDDTGTNQWDDGHEGNYWAGAAGASPIRPAGADRYPAPSPFPLERLQANSNAPLPIRFETLEQLEVDTALEISDRTLGPYGGVVVRPGGRLTLRNSTLLMNGGESLIEVRAGGTLEVLNSTIRPPTPEQGGYYFQVLPGARLVMRDSEMRGLGGWPGWGDWASLYSLSSDVVLENNRIDDTMGGIVVGAGAFSVTGNEVSHSQYGITVAPGEGDTSGGVISGNHVSRCLVWGISAGAAAPVSVTGNRLSSLWGVAISVGADALVEDNTVVRAGTGISSYHRSIVRRNAISEVSGWGLVNYGWEAKITGNSVAGSGGGIASHGNSTYCGNSLLRNTAQARSSGGDLWSCDGRGNYWSDYTGRDENGDGLGDSPYAIDAGGEDDHPLMAPAQPSSIAGRAATAEGEPVAGVVLYGLPGNPGTDTRGYYTAAVDWGFSGAAAPFKAGYAFAPPGRSYTNLGVNRAEQDYVAIPVPRTLSTVSAASFLAGLPLAAGGIVSGFGESLAPGTEVAPADSLSTSLAGTTVTVKDSAGAERLAALWFVSPSQINYLVPEGTAAGLAMVTVARQGETVAQGTLQIEAVAPGIFTANSDGHGVPAAQAVRLRQDLSQSWWYVFPAGCTPGNCTPAPIDLGPDTDQVFLILFGTGIRNRSSISAVAATIAGESVPVAYAGPAPGFVGLDQVNLRLPPSLAGRGAAEVTLTVDGRTANAVALAIR